MGFSRQEHGSGLPCPPPGGLPDPGIEPTFLMSPAVAGGVSTTGVLQVRPPVQPREKNIYGVIKREVLKSQGLIQLITFIFTKGFSFFTQCVFNQKLFFFKKNYLLIWLCQILVVPCRIFWLQHVSPGLALKNAVTVRGLWCRFLGLCEGGFTPPSPPLLCSFSANVNTKHQISRVRRQDTDWEKVFSKLI